MDHDLEIRFRQLTTKMAAKFGEGLDVDSLLVLIGIQELGQGPKKFSKDEKVNLMHVAICTILEPWGIYRFERRDDDGWPHFIKIRDIPSVSTREQEHLLKEAILNYFETNQLIDFTPAAG